jgi:predicted DsbA family dithiol-disulfide isomerase
LWQTPRFVERGPPGATIGVRTREVTVLEVFADIGCPFTHVGLRRIVARRDAMGSPVRVRAKAWPLEWVNGTPLAPATVAAEIDALRATVAPDLFVGFDPSAFPSTSIPALGLAARAYARDDATGEAVSLALRTAVFEEGRDVADPDVLDAVAIAHGVEIARDDAGVRAEYEEGRARGVVGSPYFVVAGEGYFCPSLDVEHVDGRFTVRFDAVGFETLVDRALAPGDGA